MGYVGIDYGMGKTNVDTSNGIRYGVISQHSIMPEAFDEFEADYGKPTCPKCLGSVLDASDDTLPESSEDWEQYREWGCAEYACPTCEHLLDSSDVYGEDPLGFSYDSDGYSLESCLDSDVFVLKSQFYTFAQFCSPCVPGAGNLHNPMEDGTKTYCLGHEWFDDGKAPYPVYRVSDDTIVTA